MPSRHVATSALLSRCLRPAIAACTLLLSAFVSLPAAAQVTLNASAAGWPWATDLINAWRAIKALPAALT